MLRPLPADSTRSTPTSGPPQMHPARCRPLVRVAAQCSHSRYCNDHQMRKCPDQTGHGSTKSTSSLARLAFTHGHTESPQALPFLAEPLRLLRSLFCRRGLRLRLWLRFRFRLRFWLRLSRHPRSMTRCILVHSRGGGGGGRTAASASAPRSSWLGSSSCTPNALSGHRNISTNDKTAAHNSPELELVSSSTAWDLRVCRRIPQRLSAWAVGRAT